MPHIPNRVVMVSLLALSAGLAPVNTAADALDYRPMGGSATGQVYRFSQ